jgi:hypothetical protein
MDSESSASAEKLSQMYIQAALAIWNLESCYAIACGFLAHQTASFGVKWFWYIKFSSFITLDMC